MPPFGYVPYAPQEGDRLADLILRQGQINADRTSRNGLIWGNTLANLGQTLSQGLQHYGEQKDKREADSAVGRAITQATIPQQGLPSGQPGDLAGTDQTPDIASILQGVPEHLRPQVHKALTEVQEHAAQAREFQAKADDANLKAGARLAFEARPFLDGPDGGFQAVTTAVQFAKAHNLPQHEQFEQALAQDAEAFKKAQASGDPQIMAGVADVFRKKWGPQLDRVAEAGGYKSEQAKPEKTPEQIFAEAQAKAAGERAGNPPTPPKTPQQIQDEATARARGERIGNPPQPPASADNRFWVVRDGKPLRVTEAEYRPGDLPASTREQGRPVTSGDAGRIADLDTGVSDLKVLREAIAGSGATGAAAKVGAAVPNFVTEFTGWGTDAKKKQALIDRVKQVIGKTLEGGVLRKEDEIKYEKILPTIGDPNEVTLAKLTGLDAAIRRRKEITLDSLSDAGYDTTKYLARGGGSAPKVVGFEKIEE